MTAEPTSPVVSAVEALGDLDAKPLTAHVAAFEQAYAALAAALDDAGPDGVRSGPDGASAREARA